jgi:hypothetical protein
MRFFIFAICLCAISFVFADPYVRFVNQIEGSNLTVYSNSLDVIKLEFMNSTSYIAVPSGSISVTNVVNQNGTSLTNGMSILLNFDTYATIALVWTGGQFTLVRLLENTSAPLMTDTSKAYVRVIDLGEGVQYISVATVAGAMSSYQGFLVATNYESVDPSITSEFRIFNSQTGTYNTPMITIPANLTAGNAYTVFFFTSSTGANYATLVYDRDISGPSSTGATNTNVPMTTGMDSPVSMTTGMDSPVSMTTGMDSPVSMTTGQIIGSNNNEQNSASQLCSFGIVITMMIALLI